MLERGPLREIVTGLNAHLDFAVQKLAEFSKARIPKGASETTVLENGNHGSTQGTYHIYEWIQDSPCGTWCGSGVRDLD